MKGKSKKLLAVLALVALVLTVALVATACGNSGGSGGSGGNGGGSKSLSGISVVLSDGSTLNFENGYVIMQEGALASIAKRDFVVEATYSDGSKATVTDYTIDDSALTQSTAAGDYAVILTYKGMTATVNVRVRGTAKTALLPIDTTAEYKYEYTGQAIDVLAKLDETRTAENKLSAIISSGKATVSQQQGQNERVKTDVGNYGLCLTAADGYEWKDEETSSDTLFISWQITPKVLALPTVGNVRTFEYTGSEITVPVDMKGNGEYVTLANGGDTNKGTTVGNYTVQAMIKNNYQANYTFVVDGRETGGPVDIATWQITPKVLAIPTINNAKSTTQNQGMTLYHYDYTGSDIAIVTNVDDVTDLEVIKEGGQGIVDVQGEGYYYQVTVDLKGEEKSHRENYRWADGSPVGSGVTFFVVVDPIDYVLPQAVASATLCAKTEYKPNFTFDDYDYDFALTQATQELLTESGVWLDQVSTLTYDDDKDFVAGTQTIRYLFKRSDNYNAMAIDLSVTVNSAVIQVWDPTWHGTQNVGNDGIWYDTGENNFVYNGLPQRKALEVATANLNSYIEQEGLYPKATYNVYYGATENGIDMNNPIQTTTVAANEYYGGVFGYVGENSAAVGYYKTVVKLWVDSDNYVFQDENEQEASTYELTWQIEKATLTVNPYYTGTFSPITLYSYYTGSNKTIAYSSSSATIATYYGNDGEQTLLSSSMWENDFDLDEYVTVDAGNVTTYFYDNGNWTAAANTSAIGKYKTTIGASLKGTLSDSYNLVVAETEWSIYTNTYDASAMTWVNEDSYAYGTGLPYVTNVPEGLLFNSDSYTLAYDGGFQYGHVGSNRRYVTIQADPSADGYEGVTITLPATEWEYGEDGEHNTLNYMAKSYADFTITERVLTAADLCILVEGESLNPPYEIVADGNYYSFNVGIVDGEGLNLVFVRDDDWVAEAPGCFYNAHDVGEYVLSGFIYITGDPNGDYSFDTTKDYVELMENDYLQEWSNGDSHLIEVSSLTYKYILHFHLTWHIVAPAA